MKGKLKIEQTPSNRSHCIECGIKIPKGAYRILEIYNTRFQVKDKYCAGCGINLVMRVLEELHGMLETLGVTE